ncbi:hypothetical protein, partial [Mitsuokella jalaludinii]|uniref:hypothetical protein n=1 Tax=Mitsuokella jalaludinii TaxID=187979 RepID=UPI00307E0EAF
GNRADFNTINAWDYNFPRPVDLAVHHVIVHFAQWKSPLFCVYHSLSFPEYNDSTARLFFPAKMNTRQQKAASSGHS